MNTQEMREGELSFDFSKARSVMKLDEVTPLPQGMKLVDFVVEENDRILLLEVKDPLPDAVPSEHRRRVKDKEIEKLKTKELINMDLVPKARDSYCYLHLMELYKRPFDFIFFTGADRLGVTKELLLNFQDRLTARLRKETDKEWKLKYVRNCAVLTENDWIRIFGNYPVERT